MSVDIVYSTATGRVRRVIVPSANLPRHSGELVSTVPDAQYQGFTDSDAIQGFINSVTGFAPSGDRYVSVDANHNVLGAYIADPAAGDIAPQAGATLVAHATANPGDLLWGGTLLPSTPVIFRSAELGNLNQYGSRNQPLP